MGKLISLVRSDKPMRGPCLGLTWIIKVELCITMQWLMSGHPVYMMLPLGSSLWPNTRSWSVYHTACTVCLIRSIWCLIISKLCPMRGVSHNISCVSCLFKGYMGVYGLIKGVSCIMRGTWGLILGILGHMRGVSHPQWVCIMPQMRFMEPDQKRTRPPQLHRRLYHGNTRHHDRCCSSPRVCTTPQRWFMRPNHPD